MINPACPADCTNCTWHVRVSTAEEYRHLWGQLFAWRWIDERPDSERTDEPQLINPIGEIPDDEVMHRF